MVPKRLHLKPITIGHRFKKFDMELLVVGTGGLAREFTNFFKSMIKVIGYSSIDDREFFEFKLGGKFFSNNVLPREVGTVTV